MLFRSSVCVDDIFGACCIGRLFLRYFLLYWAVFSTSNIFIIFTGKKLNLFYASIALRVQNTQLFQGPLVRIILL